MGNVSGEILSGKELLEMNLPERKCVWGDFLKTKDKMGIIAKEKKCKSFLAMQLGISISNGCDSFGYRTEGGNVLYLNFEVSKEKLKERLEDIQDETKMDLSGFYSITIPGGLELDKEMGRIKLGDILRECLTKGIMVSVVIIDPRRQAMAGDENQSEVLNRWCQNIDKLQNEFGFALIVVHHEGKGTTGAGRGSSVFDAWLTTILKITSSGFNLVGRDFEQTEIPAKFDYPLWRVSEDEIINRKSTVDKAKKMILDYLSQRNEVLQVELRRYLGKQRISKYAYQESIRELQNQGRVELNEAKSVPGHHKKICFIE